MKKGFALGALAVLAALAAAVQAGDKPGYIDYETYELDNGLQVILSVDRSTPIVAVDVWYHVGSAYEEDGRSGFAHLFEHMMFQGSENVPANGHFRHVQEAGGTLNGSTSFDRTNYYQTLPSHQLELGLWLESDRMMSLDVTPANLETQRSVVMEERRARYDNQPYGTMYEELFARAYKLQPYRWSTIGSMSDIREATIDEVRAFHAMYYRPENASLCIAGDIVPAETEALVQRYFGGIQNGAGEIFRPFVREPQQSIQVRDYVYDNIPLPAVIIGIHIPEMTAPDFTAVDLVTNILASGDSSRLHQSLVYRHRAAHSMMAFALGLELPGLFVFRATVQQGRTCEEVERLFWNEMDTVRRDGITASELEKVKNRLEASFAREITSLQSRADLLNAYHLLYRDTGAINTELERMRAITIEDIRRVHEAYLTPSRSTVLLYLPYPKPDAVP